MAKKNVCSFCGQSLEDANGLMICYKNIFMCYDCFLESQSVFERIRNPTSTLETPRQIYDYLDEYVIGQHEAKRRLAVAVYNHKKRLRNDQLKKSNILMVGPSGCGKTLLARTLANTLDVPFVIVDATAYTEKGYVGDDVENIIERLIMAAHGDLKKAEQGVVYIDEIDKIAKHATSSVTGRDASGEGVQQALLKLVEDSVIDIMVKSKNAEAEHVQFNTKNILFICGGAFDGLRSDSGPIGFVGGTENRPLLQDELVKYGIIPELLGRLSVIVELDALTEDELVKTLTEPKDSIVKEYQTLLAEDGVQLEFPDNVLQKIAHEAMLRGTGARGLRSVMEDLLIDVMFDAPDINGAYVVNELKGERYVT